MTNSLEAKINTIIGIDLGTTYSLVGVIQDGKPWLIPNRLGEKLTPSAVATDSEGRLLVGARAKSRKLINEKDVATSFKRDMGTTQTYTLGTLKFTPEELSSLVLKSLKEDAQEYLGFEIQECVISVPAYFGEAQRQATKTAAELAGLRVKRLINEPTAAALAYGLANPAKETKAVVLDLGGGTFDVTVLQIMEGVVEVKASAGDTRLGGDDFDQALMEYVYRKVPDKISTDGLTKARVKEICQRVKHTLSKQDTANFRYEGIELEITKQIAMDLWVDLREKLRGPIIQALLDSQIPQQEVDEVLLVGGSTRMPLVKELAEALFDCPILRDLPPDEAVAMGAVIAAGLFDKDNEDLDIGLTDINPFSLGVSACLDSGQGSDQAVFFPIIPRGSVIPCSRVHEFTTNSDNQTTIEVEVYQGEHIQVEKNAKIGSFTVRHIPPAPRGEIPISIRFTYDLNGLLEVEVSIKGTNTSVNQVFENGPGKMSPEALAKARLEMAKYKVSHRDEAPNKAALERAEALAVTLTGDRRQRLTRFVADFLQALDTQDPQIIQKGRETLNANVLMMESMEDW